MSKQMNKRLVGLTACTMAVIMSLSACAAPTSAPSSQASAPTSTAEQSSQTTGDKKIKLVYTVQDLANTYFVEVANGVRDRCKELGIDVTIHDGKTDAANQVSAFENFTAQGVSAIIVSPVDDKSLIPSIQAAHSAGIPVIAGNQNIQGSDAFVTVPEHEYGLMIGEAAGQWIKDKLNGTAEVAIFDYPELESIIARGDGIQEGILKIAPNAKIVARQSANNPEKGMAAMENILQAHPKVEVLAGVNDAAVLGAYEAMMAAGKASDRVFLGGLDATKEALDKIAEGGIYRATVDIQPYNTGKLFVDTALKVIKEGPIKDTIKIPMKLVDSSNIAEYKK